MTGVYFKSLYSSSSEVKEVAHAGLRTALEHQTRLPRDLLQTGLRPILMNLADPKRLSVAGLEGLARLLKLLTNYFKVEIGRKLLDHFRTIADPQTLRASARLPLSDNENITKLNRLVNIFHLLPSSADSFLTDLVDAVVQAETELQSTSKSPFSEPLGKFLDRYPTESVSLFLGLIKQARHVRTLRNVLQSRTAPAFHRELAARSWDIVRVCLLSGDPASVLPGLLLCGDLSDLTPGWIGVNNTLIDALFILWDQEPDQRSDSSTGNPESVQRYELMISLFKRALEESPRIDIIFKIITIYTRNIAMDQTSLTSFLYRHVAFSESLLFKRNVLTRFLTWFDDPSQSLADKTYMMRYVISPMILIHSRRSADAPLLDKSIVNWMHNKIWKPMADGFAFADVDELFKIELLHLTTNMVHYCSQHLQDVKKDIIRTAWAYISNEDAVVKQTAYLLAARFFESFESPPKFILRAWTGLLMPPHTEGRTLVRQALDIISPVLHRMPLDSTPPQWAKTTRKLLAEEGQTLNQFIMIYQLIVRQPDLFYPWRALFIPHMLNSLPKLGLQGSATPETRLVSLDVLSVIFKWEQKTAAAADTQSTWITPLAFRETMVSYLVRIATGITEPQPRIQLAPRALVLLKEFLSAPGWNDVSFKLDFFRKALLDPVRMNELTITTFDASVMLTSFARAK